MKPYLQIAPLAVLLAGAAIAVWRGFDTPKDRSRNKKPRLPRK
ncbi:hypothetical protein [Kangsaoukella pontilimi]|nr:hypothetical protein [Kangsaoukella pontilimi]